MYLRILLITLLSYVIPTCLSTTTQPSQQPQAPTPPVTEAPKPVVPLISYNLVTDIVATSTFAEIIATYTISSLSTNKLDVRFKLPFFERTSIVSLNIKQGDELVTTVVVDPREIQQGAVEYNSEGGLSELIVVEDSIDNTKVEIGTLLPGETKEVVLTLYRELLPEPEEEQVWSLSIPHNITTGVFTAKRNSHAGVSVLEKWEVNCLVDNGHLVLQKEETPSGKQVQENVIGWTLLKGDQRLKEDFLLYFQEKSTNEGNVILSEHARYDGDYVMWVDFLGLTKGDKGGNAQGSVNMEEKSCNAKETMEDNTKDEFIFVLDKSEAMKGDGLKLLKWIMKYTIDHLPDDVYFNIVSYGNMFYYYVNSKETVPLNATNRKAVLNWIENLYESNLPLRISNPVKMATTIPKREGYLRTMVLVTSQAVPNPHEMIAYMSENSKDVRFCHISLGDGFKHLHGDIEKAGRCMSVAIREVEGAENKIAQVTKAFARPVLEEVNFVVECLDNKGQSVFREEEALSYVLKGQPFRRWFYFHTTDDVHQCKGSLKYFNHTDNNVCTYKFNVHSTGNLKKQETWHKVAYSSFVRLLTSKAKVTKEGDTKLRLVDQITNISTIYQIPSEFTILVTRTKDFAHEQKNGFPHLARTSSHRKMDQTFEERALDAGSTESLLDKIFGSWGKQEEVVDPKKKEETRVEENRKKDALLTKIIIGICVVIVILFFVGKIFIWKYEKENAKLQEEQEKLEKQFYDRFNKKGNDKKKDK